MTTIDEVVVDGPESQLAAAISGPADGTPVLFLHGTSANRHGWDAVVDAMAEPARAVRLDQRGHGLSGDGDAYDADAFARDAAAVIRALDLGPTLVVGHSMGARNAWVLAAREPEVVSGVVAVDYTPFVEAEVLDALDARVRGGDRAFDDLSAVHAYLADRYRRLPADAIERRARFGYAPADDGLRPLARPAALAALVEGLRTDFPDEFAAVAAEGPAMVAVRGEHSAIVSPAAWARAQALAPTAGFVELADADHYVHEEQPQAVASIIDDLIRTVRRTPVSVHNAKEQPWD
ncbi:alpha/beta fold hydrolase [Agrococcus beijingensis]|uniref:alpha/beta fold hydrolase n=1 Tax=Agrococcus beijingensis TaxID=3068634 RepID=UPI0027411622|nr:alpha/beta hydrolase [Agrococcus sp. REN33]